MYNKYCNIILINNIIKFHKNLIYKFNVLIGITYLSHLN